MTNPSRGLVFENDARMCMTSPESHLKWATKTNGKLRHPIYKKSSHATKVVIIVSHPLADVPDKESLSDAIARSWQTEMSTSGMSEIIRLDIGDQKSMKENASRVKQTEPGRWSVDISDCGGVEDHKVMSMGKANGEVSEGVSFILKHVTEAKYLVFVHPRYWMDVPGSMKVLMDRVFLPGEAYAQFPEDKCSARCLPCIGCMARLSCGVMPKMCLPYSVHGLWRDKKAIVVETSGGPSAASELWDVHGNSLVLTLKGCGVKVKHVVVGNVYGSDTNMTSKMSKLKLWIRSMSQKVQKEGAKYEAAIRQAE
eukprot:GHVO01044107.1.p1 GENE.GHVO01044107.1~~GHVO01044107.1.p1  ORF type:complete len:311 (-),score=30.34 GHVO01044107.1:106-1038(-)